MPPSSRDRETLFIGHQVGREHLQADRIASAAQFISVGVNSKCGRCRYVRSDDRADVWYCPGNHPAVIHLGKIGRVDRDFAAERDRGGGGAGFEFETHANREIGDQGWRRAGVYDFGRLSLLNGGGCQINGRGGGDGFQRGNLRGKNGLGRDGGERRDQQAARGRVDGCGSRCRTGLQQGATRKENSKPQ